MELCSREIHVFRTGERLQWPVEEAVHKHQASKGRPAQRNGGKTHTRVIYELWEEWESGRWESYQDN